ncbi:hypothetical protein [Hyperthermus butylicus]|nr:hypothetical protein [Hyperthermus butylicus]
MPVAARCGPAPRRLPSLTGTDAARLDEYLPPLPSRVRVYQQVQEALNEMERSSDPVIVMLVAEWGEGKTSIYNARIRPWLESRGWASLEARAATVMEHLRSLDGRPEKSPAYRLLAAILAAGLEQAGLLAKYGVPGAAGSLRSYVENVLRELTSGGGRLVVFIDELEDLVAGASEEQLADLVAGLVGILNGDVEIVSARCSGEGCMPGSLHLIVSLTPPAYSRLMGLRDFSTIASRLKRRVRTIWIQPLPRREAFAFLESLARYSLGAGLDSILESPSMANAVVSGTLGNMGALVSAFRYLVSWARGRGGCGDRVAVLGASELVEALQGLTLSVGGAELPALNPEAYTRLMDGWEARSKLAGFEPAAARRVLDELVVRGLVEAEELAQVTGLEDSVGDVIAELNIYGESGWPRRELGVTRMVHKVLAVAAVEDAFKLLRAVEPEAVKRLPQLAPRDDFRPLEALLDSLVYMDSNGRLVVAVPESREESVELVQDTAPLELSRSEAERLAGLLWDNVFSKLAATGGARAYLLSPRLQRVLYVSPELHYLDFISDRVERLHLLRRVYSEANRSHLVAGLAAVLAGTGLLNEPLTAAGEGLARGEVRLHGAHVRILVYAVPGQVTSSEAERLEKRLMGIVMSGWRPHAVLLAYHGPVEPRAEDQLEALERKLFIKIVRLPIASMVSKVQLLVLGAKLADAAGGLDGALREASTAARDMSRARELGFDPLRLQSLLRELAGELRPGERLEKALEEGIAGTPLIIFDPKLGYDVEKPTELSGALRYFLTVPATRAAAQEALRTAYEYVMRYHIHRWGGEAARGLLSPDIERGEVGTLEKYMLLLAANKMVEKNNGTVRIDVLSPAEKAVLTALEQAGARSEEGIPAGAAWSLLVVAARNPGTKRMLLQSLLYRGLIEVVGGGKRIDPDRARIRLVDSDEDIARLVERATALLDRLASDPEALAWGYTVSAKARGYRAGSLEAFIEKMRGLLDTASEALRAGEKLMALRLLRTVIDVAEYVAEEVVGKHVKPAAETARRLRNELIRAIEEARELRERSEKALARLLGRNVTLEIEELAKLEEALKMFEEVEGLRLSEEELDTRIAELWEEARRQSPRDPGRRLPFYVQGLGPVIHFNYKLWLLAEKLREIGIAEIGDDGVRLGPLPSRVLQSLEALVEEARRITEEMADVRRRAERLAEMLKSLGVEPPRPEAIVLRGLEAPEKLTVDDALQLLRAARERVEEARRPIVELEERTRKLLELMEQLDSLTREAGTWLEGLRKASEDAKWAGHGLASRLAETAEDLELALGQAESLRAKALEALSVSPSIGEAVEAALKLVESAVVMLRDSIDRGRRIYSDVEREAERIRQALEAEAEALREALARTGVAVPEKPREADTFDAIRRLSAYIEELQSIALNAGALTSRELDAYKAIALERRRRGELLLREAVEIVAERLSLPREEAKKIIISLIEREILEPKL